MERRQLVSGLVLVIGLATLPVADTVAAFAGAENNMRPSESEDWRRRWVVGLDMLAGWPYSNDCPGCYYNFGAGMAAQLGWMLNPRMALMLDTHGVAVGQSDIEGYEASANVLVQGVVTVAVQYWPAERFWIKGGIGGGEVRGSATVSSPTHGSFEIIETETAFGGLAAAGYELRQGQTFGVNLHARFAGLYGNGLNRGHFVLGLGIAYYPR